MHILVLGQELIAPQLAVALRDLGHRITIHAGGALTQPLPELIIAVNERDQAEALRDTYNLPLAIWFSDTHRRILLDPRTFPLTAPAYQRTYFFCFSAGQRDWFRLAGVKHAMLLPLAADPQLFQPGIGDPGLGAPVSFMGELRYSVGINRMNQLLRPLRERAMQADTALALQAQAFLDFLNRTFHRWGRDLSHLGPTWHLQWLHTHCPEDLRHFLQLFPEHEWCEAIDHQLNAEQRVAVCRALANLPLSIWGDSADWSAAGTWPGHHGRRADYWHEWPAIAAQSHACLNLIRPSCWHGVPLKAFEIAAAGTLLLTNDHPSLHSVFTPGHDCLVFHSIEQARQLTRQIRQNPLQFAPIAAAGRARVLAEHTYEARAKAIVSAMRAAGLVSS